MNKAFIFLVFAVLALPFHADAGINLPYFTSALSCSDFTQTNNYEGPTGCDGVDAYGSWMCDSSHGMMINSSANYPGGAGGKGFRIWYGDSTNKQSADPSFTFSTRPTELWMRYYARWEPGFSASGIYQKMLYLYTTTGVQALLNPVGPSNCLFTAQGDGECWSTSGPGYCQPSEWKSTCGSNVMGFNPSTLLHDGSWQLFEYHFKTNTSGDNGIFEFWINDVLVFSKANINYGGGGIDRILFPSNNSTLRNGRCMYYDQDDFAFSTTGRIGPYVGAVNTSAPRPPTIQSVQ
jgi:hypothetical protein